MPRMTTAQRKKTRMKSPTFQFATKALRGVAPSHPNDEHAKAEWLARNTITKCPTRKPWEDVK